MPYLSILIPAYNRPELLADALRSILANKFQDFEILVSEDQSPRQAEVVSVLESFGSEPRLRWFVQEVNLGWSANRNFLVSHARGEFVLLMGDDDLLPSSALEKLTDFIARRPAHDIYAFGYEVIDEHGRHQYERRAARELFFDSQSFFFRQQLFLGRVVPFLLFHPFTFAYRRSLGVRFPYRPEAHIGDDFLFLFECFSTNISIAITPGILFSWRKFSASAVRNSPLTQTNLSSATNGILARVKILQILTANASWRSDIDRLFPAGDFRERFLFDTLRGDSSGSHDVLLAMVRQDPLLSKYFEDYRNRWARIAWIRLKLDMFCTYLRLNGARGLCPIIHFAIKKALTLFPNPVRSAS